MQEPRARGNPLIQPSHQQQQGIHAVQKPLKCGICGKAFLKALMLLNHVLTDSTGIRFSCPAGGNTPTENATLVRHRKVHIGDVPHVCKACGKAFSHPPKLRTHQEVHTGIKPFKHAECGKAFTCKDALVLHQRVHSGEWPYPCSQCGKSFRVLSTLIWKVHTGERLYMYRECGKFFKYNHSCVLHQRVHTGERAVHLQPVWEGTCDPLWPVPALEGPHQKAVLCVQPMREGLHHQVLP